MFSVDEISSFEEAIKTLTQREQSAVSMRFDGGKTLDYIGRDLGVSKERVRQIILKACRKLRRPMVRASFDHDYREKELYNKIKENVLDVSSNFLDFLDVGTSNALMRSGINTIGEFLSLSDEDIEKIRGIGKKRSKELIGLRNWTLYFVEKTLAGGNTIAVRNLQPHAGNAASHD